MPVTSSTDLAIKAAKDLTEALRNPHPVAPFLPPHGKHIQELKHLATIFGEMANPKAHHAPPPRVPVTAQNRQTLETYHSNHSSTQSIPLVATAYTAQTTALQEVFAPIYDSPLHFVNAVYDPITGNNLEFRQLIRHPTLQQTWLTSSVNEFGRIAQGIRDIPGTNTIQLIH